MQSAGKRKLRRQSISRGQNAGFQLARMSLQLIPMLVHTPKEVCASVYVQHYALAGIIGSLALVIVGPHLYPLGPETRVLFPPLPPLATAHGANAFIAQLFLQQCGGAVQVLRRDDKIVHLDPLRDGDPLGRKRLQLFDGVVGRVFEEASDQLKAFVIRDVRGRVVFLGFLAEVLQLKSELNYASVSRKPTCDNNVFKTVGVTARPTDAVLSLGMVNWHRTLG